MDDMDISPKGIVRAFFVTTCYDLTGRDSPEIGIADYLRGSHVSLPRRRRTRVTHVLHCARQSRRPKVAER